MAMFGKNKKEEKKDKKETTKEAAVDFAEESVALPSSPALPRGGDAHSYGVVLYPHITEKGTILGDLNKYIFRVARDANKVEIGRAIKNLYKVEVASVHISYAPAKYRQVGRHRGEKSGFKKAIVTLKKGSKIDLAS